MEFEMSSGTAGGAIAAKLTPADRPLDAQQAGRRCAHPQCSTALSRYNPDETCNAHGGWSDRTVKRPGRKPKPVQREAPAADAGSDGGSDRDGADEADEQRAPTSRTG